ncbi:hypothetical protein V8D89_000224 [Ganoderma adspersum]
MLRTRPVVLKKIATILKFHDFLFSDAASRMPHILALVIYVASDEIHPNTECGERAIEALIAILMHAPSLKSLELLSSANGQSLGYLDDPRLSATVGEVVSLRELSIGGRTEVADFIGAVRSPLTKLTLGFLNPVVKFTECRWSPASLNATLSGIAHSLQTLSIMGSYVQLIGGPPTGSPPAFTQFHAVQSLSLSSLVVVPHLPLLFELFPNLDGTVHLTTYIHGSPVFAGLSERYNFFRRAREENGTSQELCQGWVRLERLICDVETLFALNLRCPIGLTIVHEYPAHAGSDKRRYLAESLRDHPPTHLNLQLKIWWGPDEPSLDRMFPPEAAATLTHLTLCVKCDYDSSPDPVPPSYQNEALRWDDLWHNTLLPGLASLRSLTHFRLVFHCEAWEPEVPAWPISEDPFIEDLRPASTSRFDFTAMASALVDALPALRYCFMTNSAQVVETKLAEPTLVEEWCESRAWRIVHGPPDGTGVGQPGATTTVDINGARRELVELNKDVAETIIEQENLILSMEEEASTAKRNSSV